MSAAKINRMCHQLVNAFDDYVTETFGWGGSAYLCNLTERDGSGILVEVESFRRNALAGVDPVEMLRQLAGFPERCPTKMLGWLLSIETWHLELRGEPEARFRFRSRTGGGQHPARVEARITYLQTVDNEQVMLIANRDDPGRRYHSTYVRNLWGTPTPHHVGPIWDALKALTDATAPV